MGQSYVARINSSSVLRNVLLTKVRILASRSGFEENDSRVREIKRYVKNKRNGELIEPVRRFIRASFHSNPASLTDCTSRSSRILLSQCQNGMKEINIVREKKIFCSTVKKKKKRSNILHKYIVSRIAKETNHF